MNILSLLTFLVICGFLCWFQERNQACNIILWILPIFAIVHVCSLYSSNPTILSRKAMVLLCVLCLCFTFFYGIYTDRRYPTLSELSTNPWFYCISNILIVQFGMLSLEHFSDENSCFHFWEIVSNICMCLIFMARTSRFPEEDKRMNSLHLLLVILFFSIAFLRNLAKPTFGNTFLPLITGIMFFCLNYRSKSDMGKLRQSELTRSEHEYPIGKKMVSRMRDDGMVYYDLEPDPEFENKLNEMVNDPEYAITSHACIVYELLTVVLLQSYYCSK